MQLSLEAGSTGLHVSQRGSPRLIQGAAPLGPSKQAAASAVPLTYASPESVVLELSFVCG